MEVVPIFKQEKESKRQNKLINLKKSLDKGKNQAYNDVIERR